MKGKNKLILMLFAIIALVATGVSFAVGVKPDDIRYASAAEINGFSAEVDGGVIFSAERVYFAEDRTVNLAYNGLAFNSIQTNTGMQYFMDYGLYRPVDSSDYSHKDIIYNGEYLLLDDDATYTADDATTAIKQGVMITMGGYYNFDNSYVTNASKAWIDVDNDGEADSTEVYEWRDNGNQTIEAGELVGWSAGVENAKVLEYGAGMEYITAQATLNGTPIDASNVASTALGSSAKGIMNVVFGE